MTLYEKEKKKKNKYVYFEIKQIQRKYYYLYKKTDETLASY